MFDTQTAAYYHGPSQNAKGLFNLSIPSPSLPTLVNISNISLRNYFQQPSQQDTTIHTSPIEITPTQDTILSSSIENISTLNDLSTTPPAAPTAPQQPTHTNRRTQRRTAQKQQQQQNSTVVATAPQRANNNMGTAQSSRVSSSNLIGTSSHHYHTTNRRKKYSNKINRKKVDEAITLSAFAVEEDNQGNHDVAIEFYLSAVENMLEACPIHANQSRKDALKNKLRDFMDREGLTGDFMESTNASSAARAVEREELKSKCDDSNNGPGISSHIIQAAINSAVALKQSPIPDAISATVNYTMKKIRNIDQTYGLQSKAWELSRSGINMALEIDQQYNVHEKVGNAFFIGIAAAMKAGIAYKDSPSYREIRKMKTEFHNAGTSHSDNNIKESS